MDWLINDVERDLFKEIANIGLSKAADSLALLAKHKVLLKVPEIKLANPLNLIEVVLEDNKPENVFAVQSDIKGDLEGKTLLLFSKVYAEAFLKRIIEEMGPYDANLKDVKESLLMEVSNIITGSIITQFANIFKINIYGAVPKIPQTDVVKTIKNITKEFSNFQPLVFTIKTKFTNGEPLTSLPLLILFDTDTLLKLLSYLRASENSKGFSFLNKRD